MKGGAMEAQPCSSMIATSMKPGASLNAMGRTKTVGMKGMDQSKAGVATGGTATPRMRQAQRVKRACAEAPQQAAYPTRRSIMAAHLRIAADARTAM